MKSTPFILLLGFFLNIEAAQGALPGPRESQDFVLPDDLTTTSRGTMRICDSRRGSAGRKGLSFMQIDQATCPEEPQKAVGWDRPQMEPVSPGIPFQDQGIER